jgi:hypothetical protein
MRMAASYRRRVSVPPCRPGAFGRAQQFGNVVDTFRKDGAKEKAPNNLRRSGLTLNEANLLAGCTFVPHLREIRQILTWPLVPVHPLAWFPVGPCLHLPSGKRDMDFGRRDWTRTNDPHHVKVVL